MSERLISIEKDECDFWTCPMWNVFFFIIIKNKGYNTLTFLYAKQSFREDKHSCAIWEEASNSVYYGNLPTVPDMSYYFCSYSIPAEPLTFVIV